jgi:hypothetical protein
MDDRYTVPHRTISLSNGKTTATFSRISQTLLLILRGKLFPIYVILNSATSFPEHNSHINHGVPVIVLKNHRH